MIKTIVYIFSLALISCNSNQQQPPEIAIPVEHIDPSKDQKERRLQSEAYCKAHNIPIYTNPNALFAEQEANVTIRPKNEVVDRALALCYIGLKSEGLEQVNLDKMDKDFHIMPKLTANEKAYATASQPTEQQKIDANWRYESLHVMLWALGFIDQLNYPDSMCDVAKDVKIIHDLTEKEFRETAKLKTKKEILDQADLILRLNWACTNARIENKKTPGNLDKQVVFERHYALNWLINYLNQEWDNISTDT
jgi:hypothetical protein